MLNPLLPGEIFRRLEWQFIRVIPPMAVIRIVAEMMVCATDMRCGVQRIIDTIRERRCKS
jgi:hypothetical protein